MLLDFLIKDLADNVKQCENKYTIGPKFPIECTCQKICSTKNQYTDSQAYHIFFNMYKVNDPRCITCQSKKIYFDSLVN